MQVGFTTLGSLIPNTTDQHFIRTKVASNGRATFRSIFGLRIRTGGLADGIRFTSNTSTLNVVFSECDFDAKLEPWQIEVSGSARSVNVTLPVPLQLVRLNFPSAGLVNLDIHRMDGDVRAKERTKHVNNNAILSGDFTDARFAVASDSTEVHPNKLQNLLVRGHPTGARIGIAPAAPIADVTPSFFHVIPGVIGKGAESEPTAFGPKLAEALQQHFDGLERPYPREVDLLLVLESDAPCKASVSNFSVPYRLLRNSFRSVLLRPADLTNARAFTTRLREASTPLTTFLRDQLAPSTRSALDRIGQTVPDAVVASITNDLNVALQTKAFYETARFAGVALSPKTDAAAKAGAALEDVARARLNRTLLEEAFPNELASVPPADGSEKEVLRADGASTSIDVKVDLPRSINVLAATLRLEGDLRADAPAPARAAAVDGEDGTTLPLLAAPIPDARGLSLDGERSVAIRLTPAASQLEPPQPTEASGIAAALSLTSHKTELVAELREDLNDSPAGRVLASATVPVAQLDRPSWILFPFRTPVVLSAKSGYWFVLRATTGTALWLADEKAGRIRMGDPNAKSWTDRGGFNEFTLLHQIWSRTPAAAATQTGQPGGAAPDERFSIAVGDSVLTPTANGGKVRTVNITGALDALVETLSPTAPIFVVAPLRVSALGKGTVTVYPPEIEYALPEVV